MRTHVYGSIAVILLVSASHVHAEKMVTSHYAAAAPHIAAHRTLKFGTKILVTNPRNGRSISLVIGDRGPFIPGRHLDISNTAAKELGFGRAGVLPLSVRILGR